jgi:hypothetical protein
VININLKKIFIGIIGSTLCYLLINNYIIQMSVLKYILIEIIITLFHLLYEKIKHSTETELEL